MEKKNKTKKRKLKKNIKKHKKEEKNIIKNGNGRTKYKDKKLRNVSG